MAYFPNGSAGEVFDNQCLMCKFGEGVCPIATVQLMYNYDACNNKVATKILDELVKNDGTCEVFKMAESDFFVDPNQMKLEFDELDEDVKFSDRWNGIIENPEVK